MGEYHDTEGGQSKTERAYYDVEDQMKEYNKAFSNLDLKSDDKSVVDRLKKVRIRNLRNSLQIFSDKLKTLSRK